LLSTSVKHEPMGYTIGRHFSFRFPPPYLFGEVHRAADREGRSDLFT